jgi:NAD(P)-dependent dehydrogenase (short-subunit alcohol dehydrogenase family)
MKENDMTNQRPTAIVTGASSGLGLETTKAFLSEGYNVVMNGTNLDRLSAAHNSLDETDAAIPIAGDVGVAADRTHLVDAALTHFGRIDVLVNNAGIFEPRPFLEVDDEYLDRFLTINLKGTFFLS